MSAKDIYSLGVVSFEATSQEELFRDVEFDVFQNFVLQ